MCEKGNAVMDLLRAENALLKLELQFLKDNPGKSLEALAGGVTDDDDNKPRSPKQCLKNPQKHQKLRRVAISRRSIRYPVAGADRGGQSTQCASQAVAAR